MTCLESLFAHRFYRTPAKACVRIDALFAHQFYQTPAKPAFGSMRLFAHHFSRKSEDHFSRVMLSRVSKSMSQRRRGMAFPVLEKNAAKIKESGRYSLDNQGMPA
jgi:hypothetical protein